MFQAGSGGGCAMELLRWKWKNYWIMLDQRPAPCLVPDGSDSRFSRMESTRRMVILNWCFSQLLEFRAFWASKRVIDVIALCKNSSLSQWIFFQSIHSFSQWNILGQWAPQSNSLFCAKNIYFKIYFNHVSHSFHYILPCFNTERKGIISPCSSSPHRQ